MFMKNFYIERLKDVVKENVVISHASALRFLLEKDGIFDDFIQSDEYKIDVYALEQGKYDNVNYHIIDSFDDIAIETSDNLRFTSVRQSINDLLRKSADFGITDYEKFLKSVKCETCLYADHCDGYEYAPYCLAEI